MKFQFKNIRYPQSFLSTLLVVIIILATFRVAVDKGMRQFISEPSDLYVRSICGAISSLKYGRGGYVCYKDVFEKVEDVSTVGWDSVWNSHRDHQAHTNQLIQQALVLDDPSRNGIYIIGDMDAGFIDYCRLAFILFGYNIESLLYLYFLLFSVSIGIFFITFRKNNIAVLTLLIFLLAHYVVVSAAPDIGWDLHSVHNYRFMPVLAMLPLIYICMLTLFKRPLRTCVFMGALIQSMLFVFVLWIRSSALWMVALIVTIPIVSPMVAKITKIKLWPVVLILFMVLVFKITNPFLLDPAYNKDNGASQHLVWHSIYLGLVLHPDIGNIYSNSATDINRVDEFCARTCLKDNIQGNAVKVAVKNWLCEHRDTHRWIFKGIYRMMYSPDDQDGYSAAFKWLHDRGISEYYLFNFSSKEKVDYQRSFTWFNSDVQMNNKKREFMLMEDFKLSKHEKILEKVTKDVVFNHPRQVIETVFIIKPLRFLFVYFKDYRLLKHLPSLFLTLFVLLHLFLIARKLPHNEMRKRFPLLTVLFIFSMIPSLLIYPEAHVIADSALVFTMGIFYAFIILLLSGYKKLKSYE